MKNRGGILIRIYIGNKGREAVFLIFFIFMVSLSHGSVGAGPWRQNKIEQWQTEDCGQKRRSA